MKPVEYLSLATLLAVLNIMGGSAWMTLLMWALVAMWAAGSIKAFAAEQWARKKVASE